MDRNQEVEKNILINFFKRWIKALSYIGRSSIAIAFCIGPISSANSQDITRLSASQGFTRNFITSVSQDSLGYLWVGTNNALYRYDGYDFKLYSHQQGKTDDLIDIEITFTSTDRFGYTWIGTRKGINRFDPKTESFELWGNLNNKKTIAIHHTSDGYLILLTERGIYVSKYMSEGDNISFKEQHLDEINLESTTSVNGLIYNPGKESWLATTNGLIQWNSDSVGRYPFSGKKIKIFSSKNSSLESNHISSIQSIDSCRIAIGTDEGFYLGVYSTDTLTFTRINSSLNQPLNNINVTSLLHDDGNLWVGTKDNGLIRFNLKSQEYHQFKHDPQNNRTIGSNSIMSLFLDRTKTLWIATYQGGLGKLNTLQKTFIHINKSITNSNSLSNNLVDGIYEDNTGAVWVGTVSGLNRIKLGLNNDISTPVISNYFMGVRCFDIVQDNNSNFYCSTNSKGLLKFRWNNGIKNLEEIKIIDASGTQHSQFSTIFIDSKGIFWMGLRKNVGLIRYDPNAKNKDNQVIYFSGDIGRGGEFLDIAHIYEDGNNNLWLASIRNGLFRIRLNKTTRKPIRTKHFKYDPLQEKGISGDRIFSVTQDKNGYVWLGVFGGGIIKLPSDSKDVEGNMLIYNQENGLADNCVYGIICDEQNNLWISTHNGISKFSLRDSTFTSFDTNDGLQEANFRKYAFHQGKSGRIYFGGINGINIIEPDKVEPNYFEPRVAITALHVFNKKVNVKQKINGRIILEKSILDTKQLVLTNSESSFSLDFTSFHYTNPNKNRFKYKLEGYDQEWINVDSDGRKATYSNLLAGAYKFKVMAANSDGFWTSKPVELSIKILPPWWKTWWAYLVYILVFCLGLLGFRYYIVIRHKLEHDIEAQRIQQQHLQEFNNAKLQFFTNITHEFKTPLTLIHGPIQDIFNANTHLPERFKSNLIAIKNNTSRLMRLVNQLIDFRKMETGHFTISRENVNISMFIEEIINSFKALADSKKVYLSFTCDSYQMINFCDSDKIEKIVYNLVSNAIKYVSEYGLVSINVSIQEERTTSTYAKDIYWAIHDNLDKCIEIKVVNNGSIIPIDELPNIFNRYFINDNSGYNTESSTGIGLALVHGVAKLLGSGLGVYSNPIETGFIVRLPLEISGLQSQAIESLPDTKKQLYLLDEIENEFVSTASNIESLPIILIIDDDDEIRSFVQQILGLQYKVIEAENGREAYDKVLNTMPDLIISDVMMPEMDGFEFCKLIKTNLITNHIPLILLTASSTVEQEIKGIEVGADAYIPKPFNVKHLKIRVKKLLELREILAEKFKHGKLLDQGKKGMSEREIIFLNKAEEIIKNNLQNESFSIDQLAQELAFSRMQLYRKLKALVDVSPNEFIRNYRLRKAAKLLECGEMNVTEVIYETGFSHKSYFTRCFKEMYGITPKEYLSKYNS